MTDENDFEDQDDDSEQEYGSGGYTGTYANPGSAAFVLNILGWLGLVGGVLTALSIAGGESGNGGQALMVLVAGALTFGLLVGFSKALELLLDIRDLLRYRE